MWVKCGMVTKAGEEAVKAKDVNALELLRDKANGQQLVEIERMLTQIRPKR
jgi:vacuolar protein sorting-associated protein 16